MLELLALATQVSLLLLIAYNALVALWGWRSPPPHRPKEPSRRLRVVIPAHNEAHALPGVLGDLARSDFPLDIWVLSDRSEDATAVVAAEHGASVAVRDSGENGKGAALAWYLDQHPLADDEMLVVLDADNRVPPHAMGRIAQEAGLGREAVQCYLDVTNPDESLIAEAAALSYWAGNRMVQLARSNLGWSVDLGGTGMALSATALADAGGFGDTLAEDQDLGVRLLLAGHLVSWLHDVRIADEKPAHVGVSIRQRARWMSGKRAARRHTVALLRKRSLAAVDMVVRLWQPGRSFVALLSGGLAAIAALTGSTLLLPWQVWATATALQVLQPIPYLAREKVGVRRLLRYPLLVLLAALWLPVRLMSNRVKSWYHTPHKPVEPETDQQKA